MGVTVKRVADDGSETQPSSERGSIVALRRRRNRAMRAARGSSQIKGTEWQRWTTCLLAREVACSRRASWRPPSARPAAGGFAARQFSCHKEPVTKWTTQQAYAAGAAHLLAGQPGKVDHAAAAAAARIVDAGGGGAGVPLPGAQAHPFDVMRTWVGTAARH